MKTLIFSCVTLVLAASMFADNPEKSKPQLQIEERTVFVTGSLIPQRIKLQRIGNKTVSPVRIIDRQEIEQTGRRTTLGAFVNEPSARVIER